SKRVDADLRVGRFAGVFITVAAAVAHDAVAQVAHAQAPAGHIHLVDALVTQVAVAEVPLPVPIVVQLLARQRLFGSRAAPQIVVHRLGNGIVVPRTDRAAGLVPQPASQLHLADLAGADVLDGLNRGRHRAALRARLADALILAGCFHNAPAFAHV